VQAGRVRVNPTDPIILTCQPEPDPIINRVVTRDPNTTRLIIG